MRPLGHHGSGVAVACSASASVRIGCTSIWYCSSGEPSGSALRTTVRPFVRGVANHCLRPHGEVVRCCANDCRCSLADEGRPTLTGGVGRRPGGWASWTLLVGVQVLSLCLPRAPSDCVLCRVTVVLTLDLPVLLRVRGLTTPLATRLAAEVLRGVRAVAAGLRTGVAGGELDAAATII